MGNLDIGHGPGTRDNPRINDLHPCHTHRTAISYGNRTGTVVSGDLWRNDWKLVSGLWMGISERIDESGLTLGAAATAPLIAWLMETLVWLESFVLTAPLAFLIAGVWWRYARDNPVEYRPKAGITIFAGLYY